MKRGPFRRLKNPHAGPCQWGEWVKDERRGVFVRACQVPGCGKRESTPGVKS